MADSIESFVGKLQKDGVEAGKAEAARLVADAEAQGESIVADARKQAEGIIADAQAEARRSLEQGRSELGLAARDVFGRLRKQIAEAIGEVLRVAAGQALADEQFLAGLLHDVVVEYAGKDAEGAWPIEVRISDEVAEKVIDAAVRALADEGKGEGGLSLSGRLKSAGFEYAVSGGVVEVTDESIAAALGEMIAPKLRELIDKAAGSAGSDDT
jgi:V/A-type H+-transporting ATPase subunit E